MSGYRIALFLHLAALLAAIGASSIEHYAMLQVRSARSGSDALRWLGLGHALSRVFPVALGALVGTGAWMLHRSWSWGAGFVEVGLAGIVILFLSGAVIGGRAGRLARELAARPAAPCDPALVRDALWWCASWGNTGVALGVVFAMTTKPSTAGGLAGLVVGALAGCCVALLLRRTEPTPRGILE